MGGNESRHVLNNYSCILSSSSKMQWCVRQQRRAKGTEEAGFCSTSDLKGDRGRKWTQEAKGGGENEESYFSTLRGATGNSLQHAFGAELFTHHQGEELHGLHSSITIPKAENLPEASSPSLLCLSIALLQQHHSTL